MNSVKNNEVEAVWAFSYDCAKRLGQSIYLFSAISTGKFIVFFLPIQNLKSHLSLYLVNAFITYALINEFFGNEALLQTTHAKQNSPQIQWFVVGIH